MTNNCIAWHAYDKSKSPLNFLLESFDSRLKTIKTLIVLRDTPEQIVIRLKLFKEFEGKLSSALKEAWEAWEAWDEAWKEAWEAWDEARKAWDEAWKEARDEAWEAWKAGEEARDEAWEEWIKVQDKAMPEIMKLHAEQCGCAWTPENNNIFEYMDKTRDET